MAANDVFRLGHFLSKGRGVGGELLGSVRRFNQKKMFPLGRLETIDDFLGQYHAQGIAEFPDLQFKHGSPLLLLL